MSNVRSTAQADTSKIAPHSDNSKRYSVPVYRIAIIAPPPTTRTRHKTSVSAALPPILDTLPMNLLTMSQRSTHSNAYNLSSINSKRQNDSKKLYVNSLILRGKGNTHRYLESNETTVANNVSIVAHERDTESVKRSTIVYIFVAIFILGFLICLIAKVLSRWKKSKRNKELPHLTQTDRTITHPEVYPTTQSQSTCMEPTQTLLSTKSSRKKSWLFSSESGGLHASGKRATSLSIHSSLSNHSKSTSPIQMPQQTQEASPSHHSYHRDLAELKGTDVWISALEPKSDEEEEPGINETYVSARDSFVVDEMSMYDPASPIHSTIVKTPNSFYSSHSS